ncbi:hypothetical protein GBAR_LOCUS22447 [Geodia barretti]|nr:hypothetical protein GBAR_LOCUS22447 [Geodia barretti]
MPEDGCIPEGVLQEICLTTVGFPAVDTVLTISVTHGTAGPEDFNLITPQVTITETMTEPCVRFQAIADVLGLERVENLTLSLSGPPDVQLTTASLHICIQDSDDRPAEVSFLLVNATGVTISWSGNVHLSTSINYTVSLSTTGIIMNQYNRVYPPGTTSDVVVLDDDITLTDEYVHNFTLHYISQNDDVPGIPIIASFTFDKMYFQIQFGPFHFCLDWGLEKTVRIEKQLQSYLIQILRKDCADCYGLTPSFLRPGLFLCHSNPTKTTYRSTLVNPFPTTNSTHLVGIIQSWVSTGPSIVLDGLLVRVSPSCSTSISSLDEGECETGTTHDPQLGEQITQTLNVCAIRNLGEQVCRLGGC